MKTKKLIAASALALSMTFAPAVSMLNAMPVLAENVTVDDEFVGTHTFTAFQIFKGTQGKNGILGNIEWGSDVDGEALITALTNSADENLSGFSEVSSAQDVANVLTTVGNDSATALAFAKLVDQTDGVLNGTGTSISSETTTLGAGYYLIRDTSSQDQEVVGLSILQLTGTEDGIQIKPKNGKPTVDKQVKDEGDSGDTWGETADHDLNKKIDFRLMSKDLTKDKIANYDTYFLEFQDTLSAGLTFDEITAVKIGGESGTSLTNNADYTVSFPSAENNNKLTITINDLKTVTGYDDANPSDINIYVEYKAHLNDNAVINNQSGNIENNNEVQLVYSNNPNSTGHGTSEKDKVYVATFKLTNTKKALSENGEALAGAGFELHKGSGDNELVAIFKEVTKDEKTVNMFQKWENLSYVLQTGEKKMIVSGQDGDFSMYGLDAGSYTLKEVQTPSGYNTAADTTITVSATHKEADNGQSATVTIDQRSSLSTTVVNTQNGTLPETGGMGTTMIYGAGGLLVIGAAVVFITNKRTSKN